MVHSLGLYHGSVRIHRLSRDLLARRLGVRFLNGPLGAVEPVHSSQAKGQNPTYEAYDRNDANADWRIVERFLIAVSVLPP